ncbi:MAG: TIGR02757 family protein [bacterium]
MELAETVNDRALKKNLDRLYESFDFSRHRNIDPIEFPHRYQAPEDREIVAFLSSFFAYGKVELFKSFLERMFQAMGDSPYRFVLNFESKRDSETFSGFLYRFHGERDIIALFNALKKSLHDSGSLKNIFLHEYDGKDGNIRKALSGFVRYLNQRAGRNKNSLIPSPHSGSACKRLNMFLRWMVRDRDVDFGLWKEIPKHKLVIPLDIHIGRIARCLRLTQRKSDDWKTAEEITESLKRFDPEDPLKYDFALCHQGIAGICRADKGLCARCVLK